jgi:hypothetical protein
VLGLADAAAAPAWPPRFVRDQSSACSVVPDLQATIIGGGGLFHFRRRVYADVAFRLNPFSAKGASANQLSTAQPAF